MPAVCLTAGLLKSGRAQERQAAVEGGRSAAAARAGAEMHSLHPTLKGYCIVCLISMEPFHCF